MLRKILLVSLLLTLSACGGGAIYTENFNDITELPEIFEEENLVAAPDADNDTLHLIVTQAGVGESGFLYILLDESQTDYEVSMTVQVLSGNVRLWARRNPFACSGYALILDTVRDNYRLSTVNADTCDLETIDDRSRLEVNNEFEYDMRISVKDGIVAGYVDDVKYFEAPADAFPTGIPAIEVVNSRNSVGQVNVDVLTVK